MGAAHLSIPTSDFEYEKLTAITLVFLLWSLEQPGRSGSHKTIQPRSFMIVPHPRSSAKLADAEINAKAELLAESERQRCEEIVAKRLPNIRRIF